MDLNKYKFDTNKSESGVWVELEGDARLLIGRAGSKAYNSSIRKGIEKHQKNYRDAQSIPSEIYDLIVNEALAETILLDWENITINDKKLKYSKKNCLDIFSDESLEEFRNLVIQIAAEKSRFRHEIVEEAKSDLKK